MFNVHSHAAQPCAEKQSKKPALCLFTDPIARKPCHVALIANFFELLVGTRLLKKSATATAVTLKLDGLRPCER
jgi:hypothetical protein